MHVLLRKVRFMTIVWQDFFRPDAQSSNRSLKKYLQEEGLHLGHRDLVLLRNLAENRIFLSYAVLETWSEGGLESTQLEEFLRKADQWEGFRALACSLELSSFRSEEGVQLLGIAGELESETPDSGASTALVASVASLEASLSPLQTVYGAGTVNTQPGAGGMWDEDELQAESVKLLDGESSQQLVEAFRHLFRAAPNGQARASVVAAALSRHREELDVEVAQKLEEIAPAFGQAMRQLFTRDADQACRALHFLLKTERQEEAPAWSHFWKSIRPTILHSLTRTPRGRSILVRSVDRLAAYTTGRELLDHQLLETFLGSLNTLTPKQQEKLIGLIVDWAGQSSEALELLQSRLKLTAEKDQRLLLGECLRQAYSERGEHSELQSLAKVFVEEAISAGSTAGSIALTELLKAFGALVLEQTAVTKDLEKLTERQTLHVIDIWELMVSHEEELLPRVTDVYLQALESATDHLSLLLKSGLLERDTVFERFCQWLAECDENQRRRIVSAGYTWSLTVENRALVAAALSRVEWGFEPLWESEWKRPHPSYQRLGWLAECVATKPVTFPLSVEARLREILRKPPGHLYFWHLMKICAAFESFSDELREFLLQSAYIMFRGLESTQQEEREALFEVAAVCLRYHQNSLHLMEHWAEKFKEGYSEEVWWLAGVCKELYHGAQESPEPQRLIISSLIHRLISSGEQSMKERLARALAADENDTEARQNFLPLEVSNLCYEAVHAMALHPCCPAALRATVRRRLVLFLISWAKDLRKTTDAYAFRETPLFAILEDFLSDPDPQIISLLSETAATFLELHRKSPEKFRLEIRHAAQQFFRKWSSQCSGNPDAESWIKVLDEIGTQI